MFYSILVFLFEMNVEINAHFGKAGEIFNNNSKNGR